MIKEYTSAQVAAQVGTDSKSLRRFLRATPEWSNPGSGGRYSFTTADVKAIKNQFPVWVTSTAVATPKRTRRATVKVTATEGVKVTPKVPLPEVDTSESPEVWDGPLPSVIESRIMGAARAARLDQRLRATGHHLSQWSEDRMMRAGLVGR